MSPLNDRQIQTLKPKNSAYYVWDGTGRRGEGRLGVKVSPASKKTFYFRYFTDSKAQFISVGLYPSTSLAEARTLALVYTRDISDGVDPKTKLEALEKQARQREEEKQRLLEEEAMKGSLRQLVESYTENMKAEGKRTADNVMSAIETEVFSVIDETMKANEVKPIHIKRMLAKLISRGAATQSNRIRSYLHAAFNYGIKHDNDPAFMNRDTFFYLENNPVSVVPRQASAERVGNRELSKTEIAKLFAGMRENGFSRVTQILVELLFYTGGQRPYELMASKWLHFDIDDRKLWEIPPEITKNKKQHVVPLMPHCIDLLAELMEITGDSEYLFPKLAKPEEHMPTTSLAQSLRRYCDVGKIVRFQPRDIRRTCKTRMGEIGLSKEIRDKIHNHAQNDVSTKHYDRYDYLKEKKEALSQWECWLNLIRKEKT